MTDSTYPARTVPTRRISFEESLQDLPTHFAADGDLILSHIAAALSARWGITPASAFTQSRTLQPVRAV